MRATKLLVPLWLVNVVPVAAVVLADPPPLVAPCDTPAARAAQEAWAKHFDVQVDQTNSLGMKLTLIPAGKFTMGSSESRAKRRTR